MPANTFNRGFSAQQIGTGDQNIFRSQNLDPRGSNELATIFQRQGAALNPQAASRTAFNAGRENDFQDAIMQLLARRRNRNYGVLGQRAGNAARQEYGQQQRQAALNARSMGLGEGAQLGASNGLSSNAARYAAGAEETYRDPRNRDQDLESVVQLLQQVLADNPALSQQLGLYGAVQQSAQANQANRSQGLGSVIPGLLGSAVSGGAFSRNALKGLF